MSKLTVRYSDSSRLKPILTIDGKDVKGEKKNNSVVYTYETNEPNARVRVFNVLEASSPLYFLMSIFYFFLSVFGIFDDRSDNKCRKVSFDASVSTVSDCELKLLGKAFPKKPNDAEAIKTECTGSIDVYENKFSVDKTALRRTRIMTAARVVLFIASIAVILALAIK